jgi:serine/threonine protein kinase
MAVDLAWLATEFPDLDSFKPAGVGGQKEVFLVRVKSSGQPAVLKLFHVSADPERALREIQAVGDLGMCRVPRIHSSGRAQSVVGTHIWFIEQFVDGRTLEAILLGGPQALPLVRRWAEQIFETLISAEAAAIVHRDIKPANIIVDAADDAWLIDFGIARHLGLSSLTPTSAYLGPHSPGYAPPEQFTNSKAEVDTRTDLFALGVVIYECLEGVNPHTLGATTQDEVYQRMLTSDLPRLSAGAHASTALADLVQSLTRRRKTMRPASAREALEWLRES